MSTILSPTGKTSLTAATFAMMASALSADIFNLAVRVKLVGIAMYAIYISIACAFSYCGCLLLQGLILKKGFRSYGEVSHSAYGPGLRVVTQVFLIFMPWAITVCSQVLMPKFIIEILADDFGMNLYENRYL